MRSLVTVTAIALALSACAGRSPQPVATSQAGDHNLTCEAIQSETHSNTQQIAELGSEKGWKTAQNVTAGVTGLFIWPLWLLMDFKGAAGTEQTALQNRNVQLASLAQNHCDRQEAIANR